VKVPLTKRVKQLLKQANMEEDLIDKSLSEEEILSKLKEMGITEKSPTTKEEYFAKFESELKKRIEQDIEELKKPNPTDAYYKEMYEVLDLFLNSPTFNLLIISGRAGIGKSYKIMEWCGRNNIQAFKYNGHITNFRLFHILYDHSNSLIIFDDSNPILEDVNAISLLLQACETMKTRTVSWNTSHSIDIPQQFAFDGKIVILTNKSFSELDDALQSRAIKFSLDFNNFEILEIINSLCQLPEKNMIINLLKENINKIELNLRLYKLLENLLLYLKDRKKLDKFKKFGEIIIEMETNPNFKIAYEILKTTRSIKNSIKLFTEKTGLRRTAFYYYKKKIENLYGVQFD
jgi:hypothetical protein